MASLEVLHSPREMQVSDRFRDAMTVRSRNFSILRVLLYSRDRYLFVLQCRHCRDQVCTDSYHEQPLLTSNRQDSDCKQDMKKIYEKNVCACADLGKCKGDAKC